MLEGKLSGGKIEVESGNDPGKNATEAAALPPPTFSSNVCARSVGNPSSRTEVMAAMEPSSPTALPTNEGTAIGNIILTPHPHDVLSGRGATVNAHSGNRHFRTLCWSRKPDFDAGNHVTKKLIAAEIVHSVMNHLDPPGRFLVKVHLPQGAVEGFRRTGYIVMSEEKAVHKACQVMRDVNRPDRINRPDGNENDSLAHTLSPKESSNVGSSGSGKLTSQPKKRRKSRATPVSVGTAALTLEDNLLLKPDHALKGFVMTATIISTPAASMTVSSMTTASARAAITNSERVKLPEGSTQADTIQEHDVLSGRGAYVNAHPGNKRLRTLALERKNRFDAGTYTEKKALATEIVKIIKGLDPPGRFLKRSEDSGGVNDGWYEITEDRSIHKACQVMRDLKRPDRICRSGTSSVLKSTGATAPPTVTAHKEAVATSTSAQPRGSASSMNVDHERTADPTMLEEVLSHSIESSGSVQGSIEVDLVSPPTEHSVEVARGDGDSAGVPTDGVSSLDVIEMVAL